jgi:hypothetical protein
MGWNATDNKTACGPQYRGYLCGACAVGFYSTKSDPACRSCSGGSTNKSNTMGDAHFLIILGSFLCAVLMITVAVVVAVGFVGGDKKMGRSRARKVCYWSIMSLQTVAQVGEHSTGYESPLLLQAYAVLSAVTTFETSEVIHPECSNGINQGGTFLVSNVAMGANLGLLVCWSLATFCCNCKKKRNICLCCAGKYPLANLRQSMLRTLLFLYSIISRTAFKAIMCVEYYDSVNGKNLNVLQSNPVIQCYSEFHFMNGTLGWITLVVYCICFPLFLLLLLYYGDKFDHSGRKMRSLEKYTREHLARHLSESGDLGTKRTTTLATNAGEAPAVAIALKRSRTNREVVLSPSSATTSKSQSESQPESQSESQPESQVRSPRSRHCCDVLRNFAHHHERRIVSVYSFVNYRRDTYLTFKPIVDNNFHTDYLAFRPTHMYVMLGLAAGPSALGGVYRYEKLILSASCLLCYIALLLWFKPMRKTKSWIFPVLLCIWFAGFCALTLSFMASNMIQKTSSGNVEIQSGQFDAIIIYNFSLFILSFLALLIGIVIPCAAVYGAILGARGDQKKEKVRELLDKQLLIEEEEHPLEPSKTKHERKLRRSQVLEVMEMADDEHEIQDLLQQLQKKRSDARHTQELEMTTRRTKINRKKKKKTIWTTKARR